MLEVFQMSAVWWANVEAQRDAVLGLVKSMGDQWVDVCVSELSGAPSSKIAHDLLRSYREARH